MSPNSEANEWIVIKWIKGDNLSCVPYSSVFGLQIEGQRAEQWDFSHFKYEMDLCTDDTDLQVLCEWKDRSKTSQYWAYAMHYGTEAEMRKKMPERSTQSRTAKTNKRQTSIKASAIKAFQFNELSNDGHESCHSSDNGTDDLLESAPPVKKATLAGPSQEPDATSCSGCTALHARFDAVIATQNEILLAIQSIQSSIPIEAKKTNTMIQSSGQTVTRQMDLVNKALLQVDGHVCESNDILTWRSRNQPQEISGTPDVLNSPTPTPLPVVVVTPIHVDASAIPSPQKNDNGDVLISDGAGSQIIVPFAIYTSAITTQRGPKFVLKMMDHYFSTRLLATKCFSSLQLDPIFKAIYNEAVLRFPDAVAAIPKVVTNKCDRAKEHVQKYQQMMAQD